MTQTLTSMGSLAQGVNAFNRGEYWVAHEAWEAVWKTLQGDEKTYVQGLIQACGAFHHLINKRISPAKKLSKSAYDKLRVFKSKAQLHTLHPRVEIPGLTEKLFDIFSTLKKQDFLDPAGVKNLKKLQAILIAEPPPS